MKITILGAGITGLRTADLLSKDHEVTIIEKEEEVGGMSASLKTPDNTFLDYGPHKIFSKIPGIMDEFKTIVPMNEIKKKNSIYLQGKYLDFPVKMTQLPFKLGMITFLSFGIGYALSLLKPKKQARTYEEYFIQGFGKPAYNLIFKQMAEKMWAPPQTLSEELGRKRVPVPNILNMIKSTLSKKGRSKISANTFLYPKKKGIGAICEALEKRITNNNGKIIKKSTIKKIIIENNKPTSIILNTEQTIKTDFIISTIPLKSLLKTLQPTEEALDAAQKLKYKNLTVFYLFLNKQKAMEDNWVFFPETSTIFSRVAELKSFCPESFPKNKTVISAEVPHDNNIPEEEAGKRVVEDLIRTKIIKPEDIIEKTHIEKMTDVYPIYDLDFRENLEQVYKYLDSIGNLITLGRQGCYNYNNMDHCMDMAQKATKFVNEQRASIPWSNVRKTFDEYTIMD